MKKNEMDPKSGRSVVKRRIVTTLILGVGLLLFVSTALFGKQTETQQPKTATTSPGDSIKAHFNAIQWPMLEKRGMNLRQQFTNDLINKIDTSPVPVLLPQLDQKTKITIGIDLAGYFAHVSGEEGSFTITATRILFNLPGLHDDTGRSKYTPQYHVRGLPAWIGEGEGRWSVAWEENGAAYEITFGCSPSKGQSCGTVEHAQSLANSLVFVGGAR